MVVGFSMPSLWRAFAKSSSFTADSILAREPSPLGRITDGITLHSGLFSDPFGAFQWHLSNNGQAGGIAGYDLNVIPVWRSVQSYEGRGVTIGIYDSGVQYTHPDLDRNYDANLNPWFGGYRHNPYPNTSFADNAHGTAVAGIILGEENNGIGIMGVAPAARYGATDIFVLSEQELISSLGQQVRYDVTNHSWGYVSNFVDNFRNGTFVNFGAALANSAMYGREGLGTAIVHSAGNSRGEGQNTNYHNWGNSEFEITVAAGTNRGDVTWYSTPGASVLVTGFADRNVPTGPNGWSTYATISTDFVGNNGFSQFNTIAALGTDYTDRMNGTSAAAPMVAGVVALMLEANPNLGWRDVQDILAYSARTPNIQGVGAPGSMEFYPWKTNGARDWNGGGLNFSEDYGFGLVDATAAVRLAETWTNQNTSWNERRWESTNTTDTPIPDGTGLSANYTFTYPGFDIEDLDRVFVDLDISHTWRGDLRVVLTSPSGTESVLIDRPGRVTNYAPGYPVSTSTYGDSSDNIGFRVSSNAFRGESIDGTWTVKIFDDVAGDAGTVTNVKLGFLGDTASANDTYVYTNEFGDMLALNGARGTLSDVNGGVDTINAGAVSSASSIDLRPGQVSLIDGSALTIAAGSVIENAFGGDAADTMLGNDAVNWLRGMRGNDWLRGFAGADDLDGGHGTDTAQFAGALAAYDIVDFGLVGGVRTVRVLSGPDGADQLRAIERLAFDDGTVDIVDADALFDTLFYARTYADIHAGGVDGRQHYAAVGWTEGRDPNAFFDTNGYRDAYLDIRAAGINPLEHYRTHGWAEGRDPSVSFDTQAYLARNPDVAAAGMNPLQHYLEFGRGEGREAYAMIGNPIANGFDAQFYRMMYPDIAAAGIDPLSHFMEIGWREGRDPNAYFSTSGYLTTYADIAAANINPLEHYLIAGWSEGRDPSARFDTDDYLAAYADVAAAAVNPFLHFLFAGNNEGRHAFGDGIFD